MMNTKWSKKKFSSALAFLLALTLSVSNLPVTAYAAETSGQDTTNGSEQSASDISGNLAESTLTVTASEEQTYVPEDGLLADNDELAEGYIETVLGISDEAATVGTYGESSLSGLNKTIYTLLKEKVAVVAAATSTTSTSFTLTVDELGLPTTNTSYTASDLGVSSLGTVTDGTITLADDVDDALSKEINKTYAFDMSEISALLCVNCPYELYWYDKKNTTLYGYPYGYSYSYNPSTGEISAITVVSSSLTVKFPVASAYQDSTSTEPTYTMSGATSATVQTAVEKAESIVEKYASESDYNKLLGYKKEICSLVSYNDDAASSDYTGGYGDPWQLIYVFDEDTTTNVVCEGYSKAFQYLCDLTDFSSDDVICYTVTGKMSGGTGAGPHMWNIVTMEDGANYLVDVTNCDTGTVGADAQLFLAGTAGSITSGYTFTVESGTTVSYVYDDDTKELYGTDDNSLLNLASSDYTPKATVLTAPTACSLTYDNTAHALVSAGTAQNGTMVYSLSEDGDYDSAIPAETEAGTYTVYYKAVGDENYGNSKVDSVSVTINQATPLITSVSAQLPVYPSSTVVLDGTAYDSTKTYEISGKFTLDDGQTLKVESNKYNYTFTPDDTKNYKTVKGTVSITVTKNTLESINIGETAPEKTVYTYGEAFEINGLTVTAYYADGSTVYVTDKVTAGELVAEQNWVELSYTDDDGNTAKCEVYGITVNKAQIDISALKWDISDSPFVYDGSEKSVTLSGTLPDGAVLEDQPYNNSATNAGTYTATAVIVLDADNNYTDGYYELVYNGTSVGSYYVLTADWSISKGTLKASNFKFSVNGDTTYTGDIIEPAEISSLAEGIGDVTVKYYNASDKQVTPTDVGTYTVKIDVTEGDNYNAVTDLTDSSWTFTITEAAFQYISAENVEATYDGETSYGIYVEGVPDGATVTYGTTEGDYSLTSNPGFINAGEYTVYYKVSQENYTDMTGSATVTIEKATPNLGTVSVSEPEIIYLSTKMSAVTLSRTDTTVPGTLALDVDQTFAEGVAEYSYTFTPDDKNNYNIVTGKIEITVISKALTGISIDSTVPDKTTYTYGDTFDTTGLTVTATYDDGTTADVTSRVTFDTLSVGQTEIVLSYTEGGKTVTCTVSSITVGKKQLDVSCLTWNTTGSPFTYNGDEQSVTLKGEDELPTGVAVSTDGISATNAGSYTATAMVVLADGYSEDNYTIICQGTDKGSTCSITAEWSISKATLTAGDFTFSVSGDTTYTGEAIKAGNVTSQADGIGTVTVKYYDESGNKTTPVDVGTYTVKIDVAGSDNYEAATDLTADSWEFTITKAKMTGVKAENVEATYDGNEHGITVTGMPSGATVTYSTDGTSYDTTNPGYKNVGTYTVYYKAVLENYEDAAGSATITISKATPDLGTVSVASPATIYMSNTDSITLKRTNETVPGTLALDVNQTFTVGTKEYSYTFTPNDMDNYETVTGKIEITVTPNTLSSISVGSTTPTKTAYTYGDTFETTGLTVTATYADGTTADVTSSVTFGTLSVGQTEITLSYTEDGKTVTCTVSGITVAKATLTVGGETALTAPYGAKLSEITPVLTAKLGSDEVEGSWAWVYDTTYTAETILDANTAAYTLTTKFTPAGGADNYNELTQTISLTITKVDPVVTAPTANDLTYTGDAQALVTAGSTTGGSLYYSLDGETYTNTVPTAAGAGDYTVYYKVTGGSNYNDVAATAVSVTIRQETPVLGTVSVSAPETIYPSTALSAVTLSRTDTTVPGTLALAADQTFTAGTKEYSYTFTPEDTDNYETVTGTLAITVTANTLVSVSAGDTEPTKTDYTYGESFDTTGLTVTATYADGSKADVTGKVTYGALVAGQTEITLTYTEDGISASCTISGITVSKAVPVVTAPTANELTYNGKAQALVTAGSTTGGTLYYSLDGENYTNTVPTATETGTYTVYYKVLGGSNYEDTAPQTLEVTVKPETTSKLVTKEGIQEIPETLKAAGFDTEEKITAAMLEKVVVESSGYTSENSKVYDAELWISTDGGKTWIVATEENFPQEGLTVTLPYPDGTSKDGYEFSVAHMFTHTMYGYKPGEIETPTVTKTDEGIQFTVHGLSPIMVAWKEVSQESSDTQTESDDSSQETDAESSDSSQEAGTTASTSPVTGDTNALWLWIAVLAAAVGVMVGLVWYRKAKK